MLANNELNFRAALIAALQVLLLASWGLPAQAHDNHAQHRPSKQAQPQSSVEVKLSDAKLFNQDGRPVRFKSEVVGDKIVIMDFVYTTCTTVCPVISALFSKLQDRLGERLGRDVELVSMTLDPVRDTPSRLKAYAAQHNARAGWTWLTGEPKAVNDALKGLGAYASDVSQHPSMVLIGDARSGAWIRLFGFPDPDRILAKVEQLLEARVTGAQLAQGKD